MKYGRTTTMAMAGAGARPMTLGGSGYGLVGAGRVGVDVSSAARRPGGRGGGASG